MAAMPRRVVSLGPMVLLLCLVVGSAWMIYRQWVFFKSIVAYCAEGQFDGPDFARRVSAAETDALREGAIAVGQDAADGGAESDAAGADHRAFWRAKVEMLGAGTRIADALARKHGVVVADCDGRSPQYDSLYRLFSMPSPRSSFREARPPQSDRAPQSVQLVMMQAYAPYVGSFLTSATALALLLLNRWLSQRDARKKEEEQKPKIIRP